MDYALRWVLCLAIALVVIASEAKQSRATPRGPWIASPLARLAMTSAAAPTHAQVPPGPPPTLAPKPCADGTTQGRGAGRPSERGGPNQDLSEKLDEGKGVLCPPPTGDPIIETPPPNAGRTPVLPAPGTPGGDPKVQPK